MDVHYLVAIIRGVGDIHSLWKHVMKGQLSLVHLQTSSWNHSIVLITN